MKVLEPEFIDIQKTKIKFKIEADDGRISTAELTVPKDGAKGVNKYWDMILENYDINVLRKRRNEKEVLIQRRKEMEDKQRKANAENQRLRILFDKKMAAFQLPFIKESDPEIRSAIRRAPTSDILDMFLIDYTLKFMKDNNMSYVDYLDYLDDIEDKKQEEKDTQ